MKLLILATFKNRKHLVIAFCTTLTVFALSIANTMEMFAIGIMANTGCDFFSLFRNKEQINKGIEKVSKGEIERRWRLIDKDNKGYISRRDASRYLSKVKEQNLLNRFVHLLSCRFDFEQNFMKLILFLVCVALFKALFLFSSRYCTQLFSIRVTRDLRLQYFEHIQSLPMSFYHEYNLGSLTTRAVGDAGQIASSINSLLTNYLQTPFIICSNLIACICLSWQLSLVIFVGVPFILLPVIFLTRRVKRISRQMQKNQEIFTSVLLDFLSGIETVKIFAIEKFSLRKFKKQNNQIAQLEAKNAKYSLLTRPILHAITTFCLAIVVFVGLYSLHLTVAQLILFCGLLHLFYEPVKKFAEENTNIQRGVVAAERMFEVLKLKPKIKDIDGAIEMKGFQGAIEFTNVSFRYRGEWVIRDLNLRIEKGQTVAIVGPTGGGKTTIIRLLSRLYEPQEGTISIDGIPIQDYTQKSLRENISIVPQRPFLFYDTILENITFGRNVSMRAVQEAAKKAYAHEFIVELPSCYDHIVSEEGKTLSGGQQQRLAIARALLKNAPILILDEATSSLDALSENRIQQAIEQLRGHLTQIIIAHRLSTVEHADKIVYLDKGRKIIEGTKEMLLENSLEFRMMWEQFHRISQSV